MDRDRGDLDGWHMWGEGWSWWIGGVMTLTMIALVVLAVWAIIGLLRGGGMWGPGLRSPEDARAILDRRLASGEIDTDEYRRRRAALDGEVGGD